MSYHDYAWECKTLPFHYRVAELYARMGIGVVWGLALVICLSVLTPPEGVVWESYALAAILLLGVEKAMPAREMEADSA